MLFNNVNVYIEHGNHQYTMLFIKLGFIVVNDVAKADLVCFTGGADVSPHLYNSPVHPTTCTDGWRDAKEQRLFEECVNKNIPMVGICRGGQFLNVMNGGEMYQDVTKHCQPHALLDLETGEHIWVSSTHHQMMRPAVGAVLVATAEQNGKREWYHQNILQRDVSKEDIEVVFYEKTRALCFQPHPEFSDEDYEGMFNYFGSLLKRFLKL